MKYLLIGILILCFLYLNRAYSYFYGYFNANFIAPPARLSDTSNSEKSRFVTLGDSLLDGVGSSSEDKTLGYLLHKGIDSQGKTDLVNLAVSGATVEDVLKKQLPRAIEQKPEEVILFIGVNDVHNLTGTREFETDYKKILDELILTKARITVINIPYLGSDKILLPPWNLFIDSETVKYNNIIKKLASERGIQVIDLYGVSKRDFVKSSPLYATDEFHPSDKGYALWAQVILSQYGNSN